MGYAIVKIGGSQIKVEEGQTIKVPRVKSPSFDVLAYNDGAKLTVGEPLLTNVTVKASITAETAEKTRVARFRAKSRYRKVKGHKQPYSQIRIDKILVKASRKHGA
ncbi:MAG: 50S ribosomal protein L21 [candidate division WWE3 bacterium GW2011_GWA1_46_21]|uniref:Large ribosomal subunit protein bL21 n=4 Tax=Katanobacteria TaxID=422282 RepID=A0A0G1PCZ2_UNCKA|nr:MAG: 50S ribosomal protein L21 [candidate division WWE3 bacterium GW2011_GWA1_46_21]KKU49245.1 MAG: 50S ribosomal protein L21 [candidate division WWE3 bacterium GW2011_GWA2_46_9]KKU50614.1 MAG: large subunit ribosomal protein L21 [candidate division WWE3 bacterium GW2011_GWC1_47_10]KKU57335.1 MAG: 50S ribosomal protein L21 [candidate division WWE3 bacterium GW2011_GWB1_47_11]